MKNKKGFTLAELLIVVAIIAVLVAIAIPIFSAQLEKSREATDIANTRSLYAEVVAAALTQDAPANIVASFSLKQQVDDWQGSNPTDVLAQINAQYSNMEGSPDVVVSGTPHQNGVVVVTYTDAQGTTSAGVVIEYR